MTDREFLQARSTFLKRRIKESSSKMQEELERAVGPSMREHPHTGLLAGAMGGIALGSAVGIARRPAGGLLSMLTGTGLYAARVALVRSLLDPDSSQADQKCKKAPADNELRSSSTS